MPITMVSIIYVLWNSDKVYDIMDGIFLRKILFTFVLTGWTRLAREKLSPGLPVVLALTCCFLFFNQNKYDGWTFNKLRVKFVTTSTLDCVNTVELSCLSLIKSIFCSKPMLFRTYLPKFSYFRNTFNSIKCMKRIIDKWKWMHLHSMHPFNPCTWEYLILKLFIIQSDLCNFKVLVQNNIF